MDQQIKIEKSSQQQLKSKGVFSWPIWEKEVSEFPWTYDQTEECYILEGRVVVEPETGEAVEFGVGDFVTFPRGLNCTWKILESVKKHYRYSR
ncbi:MAG: hypothetical protein ACD_22C00278G0010 [uncultured bacterium]|nr:MAG: hypothetical protein ACD_22C00278G0010 [uncultured bacterium]